MGKNFLVTVLLLASFGQLFFGLFKIFQSGGILPDLANYYYQSGVNLRQGINPYTKLVEPISYPPPALVLFYLTAFGSLYRVQIIWTWLSFLALLASVVMLSRNRGDAVIFLAFVWLSFPIKFTFGMGQVNHFILLFIVLNYIFYLKRKDILSGIFLGLALLFKPIFVLLILFFFGRKKTKILTAALAVFGLGWLASYFVMDQKIFFSFFPVALPRLVNNFGNNFYYNQSLQAALTRILGTNYLVLVIYFLLVLVVLVMTFAKIFCYPIKQSEDRFFQDELAYSLVLVANLLLTGLTWQHHLIFLIPPMIVLYRILAKKRSKKLWWFLLGLIYLLLASNIRNPQIFMHTFWGNLLLSHGTIGVILLWFILSINNR